MIVSTIAAIAFASFGADPAQPRIAAVSMFKNGFSFIARETLVPGSGQFVIDEPPQAAHGTFWHLPSDGISILRTASTTIEQSSDSRVESLGSVISLNTGKQVTVDFDDQPAVSGKLMRSVGDQIVLKTTEGVVFVNRGRIKRLFFSEDPKVETPV